MFRCLRNIIVSEMLQSGALGTWSCSGGARAIARRSRIVAHRPQGNVMASVLGRRCWYATTTSTPSSGIPPTSTAFPSASTTTSSSSDEGETGGSTPTDYSTVDTNKTTFAIKNKGRVFRELEMRYGWPIDKDNIHMRYQNLRKNEVQRLYDKLKMGILSDFYFIILF